MRQEYTYHYQVQPLHRERTAYLHQSWCGTCLKRHLIYHIRLRGWIYLRGSLCQYHYNSYQSSSNDLSIWRHRYRRQRERRRWSPANLHLECKDMAAVARSVPPLVSDQSPLASDKQPVRLRGAPTSFGSSFSNTWFLNLDWLHLYRSFQIWCSNEYFCRYLCTVRRLDGR